MKKIIYTFLISSLFFAGISYAQTETTKNCYKTMDASTNVWKEICPLENTSSQIIPAIQTEKIADVNKGSVYRIIDNTHNNVCYVIAMSISCLKK